MRPRSVGTDGFEFWRRYPSDGDKARRLSGWSTPRLVCLRRPEGKATGPARISSPWGTSKNVQALREQAVHHKTERRKGCGQQGVRIDGFQWFLNDFGSLLLMLSMDSFAHIGYRSCAIPATPVPDDGGRDGTSFSVRSSVRSAAHPGEALALSFCICCRWGYSVVSESLSGTSI